MIIDCIDANENHVGSFSLGSDGITMIRTKDKDLRSFLNQSKKEVSLRNGFYKDGVLYEKDKVYKTSERNHNKLLVSIKEQTKYYGSVREEE